MFDQISDYDVLAKLTHKTNYRSPTREGHFDRNRDFWWKNISGLEVTFQGGSCESGPQGGALTSSISSTCELLGMQILKTLPPHSTESGMLGVAPS